MDDPIFTSTNTVGGSSMRSKYAAMPEKIHSDQSFILIQQFVDPDTAAFDISSSVCTLYVAGFNNTLDRVALASGVLSDSGSGTIDTVTFTVPKNLIPTDLGALPQRNPGNSVFFYILEDTDSILEFAQEVNVIDPSYDLQGSTDPGSSTITTQRNDLGTVEDTTIVTPPAQTFGLAYVVGPAGATGAWAAHENNLAVSNGSNWIFTLPEEGNFVFDKALGAQKVYSGTAWEVSAGGDMLSGVYDPQAINSDAFDRANMTGTQSHTTISDYDTELAGTANVTSFTPTADYHPATKKYVDDATPDISLDGLTDVSITAPAQGDIIARNGTEYVNLGTGNNGQVLTSGGAGANVFWQTLPGGGDMTAATYDPAAITEQLVGLTASQTLTNKTVNGVTLTTAGSASNFLNEAGNYVPGSGGASLPVDDTTSIVQDPVDNSKQMRIDAGNISTATTRVLTMPDTDANVYPQGRISPTVTATTDINWAAGDTFALGTLTLDVTLTFSNVLQGQTIAIEYTGDSGFDVIALPGSVKVLNGGASTADSFNVIYLTATNGATEQQAAYSTDTAADSGGGGILPSGNTSMGDADYTVLAGDVGFRVDLPSSATVDRVATLDVSLLADDTEQISFINQSDYRLEIVVSSTGTMTINNLKTNHYLWKGDGVLTLNGDTATNNNIVAG